MGMEKMQDLMKSQIKMYCDRQVEIDNGFAENYREDYLDKLCKHVNEKARKVLNNSNGMLPDDMVFKWVRDYYNDHVWEEEETLAKTSEKTKTNSPTKKQVQTELELF